MVLSLIDVTPARRWTPWEQGQCIFVSPEFGAAPGIERAVCTLNVKRWNILVGASLHPGPSSLPAQCPVPGSLGRLGPSLLPCPRVWGPCCNRRERAGLWAYLSHNGVPGADVVGPAIQAGLGGPLGVIGQAGVGWIYKTEARLRLLIRAHGEHPGPRGGVGWWATVVGGGGRCEDLQQVVVGHAEDREAEQDRVQELEGPFAGHAVHELSEGHGTGQDEPELRVGHQAGERDVCMGVRGGRWMGVEAQAGGCAQVYV